MKLSTLSFIFISVLLITSCGSNKTNTTEEVATEENKVAPATESTTEEDKVDPTTEPVIEEKTTNDVDKSNNALLVFMNDPDKSGTNIRKSPNGDVLMKIVQKGEDDEYLMYLSEAKKGWFKVEKISGMEGDVAIKGSEAWVHGSVLGVGTINYGGETLELLDAPKSGKVVERIKEEATLKLKDMQGDWVKVEYKGVSGWIHRDSLCGSSLTNCS